MIESLFSSQNYDATKRLLDAAVLRQEALATNIANVETPGFKRMDLDRSFATEFAKKMRSGDIGSAPTPQVVEDTKAASQRADGNSVQLDAELLAMGQNSAEYEALTEFVSGSLKQLRVAITGRNS